MADDSRGRNAKWPTKIPKSGWKDILLRIKDNIGKDNVSVISAGIAFFFFLAVFPAIGAMVAIYGLVSDPIEIREHLATLAVVLPPEALAILQDQLTRVAESGESVLSFGVFFGIALAVWSSSKGIKALIKGLNVVYKEKDGRNFIKFNAVAYSITFCAILFALLSLAAIVAFPAFVSMVVLSDFAKTISSILRWPLLAIFVMLGLALLYRYAPHREHAKFRWVSWGSFIATVLWIVISVLFSFYVAKSGKFNETYGSLGAVIILQMWFYMTAFAVLLGGEFNSEIEHQTRIDSTVDPPRPMGDRGAYVADTVGEKKGKDESDTD